MTETTNSPTKPNEPACTECSRLASRVENEKVAHKMCDDMAHDAYKAIATLTGLPFDGMLYDFEALVDSVKRKLLAGAHAEEKE